MLIKHRGIEKIKRGKCLSRINLELVNTTHAESLRYWKQNYEVQITQPFCEVSYLSHREPKAACAARLTPDSPGLGPGGGRGWGGRKALQQCAAWLTRAFPNAPPTALHSLGHLQIICVGRIPIGLWPFYPDKRGSNQLQPETEIM